jgi:hypothetical protein
VLYARAVVELTAKAISGITARGIIVNGRVSVRYQAAVIMLGNQPVKEVEQTYTKQISANTVRTDMESFRKVSAGKEFRDVKKSGRIDTTTVMTIAAMTTATANRPGQPWILSLRTILIEAGRVRFGTKV